MDIEFRILEQKQFRLIISDQGLAMKKVAEAKRLKCIAYAVKLLRIVTGLR